MLHLIPEGSKHLCQQNALSYFIMPCQQQTKQNNFLYFKENASGAYLHKTHLCTARPDADAEVF